MSIKTALTLTNSVYYTLDIAHPGLCEFSDSEGRIQEILLK